MTVRFAKVGQLLNSTPRVKSRYDFIQATATINGFEKGNIIRLANFLIKSGECANKSEAFSKAWELAKGRNAQFVKYNSDLTGWTKRS